MRVSYTHDISGLMERRISVIGSGAYAELAICILSAMGHHDFQILDVEKYSESICGIPIGTLRDYMPDDQDVAIVAYSDLLPHIVPLVQSRGFKHIVDVKTIIKNYTITNSHGLSGKAQEALSKSKCFRAFYPLPIIRNGVDIHHLEIMATEACNLRCASCAAAAPLYDDPQFYDPLELYESLSHLIACTNWIGELCIMGGEPMLHPQIDEIISLVSGFNDVGLISIYTNGLITPRPTVLQAMRDARCWVHVSNYGINNDKVASTIDILKSHRIEVYERRYAAWQNPDSIVSGKPKSEAELIDQFRACYKSQCYSLQRGNLYRCVRASSRTALGYVGSELFEHIDLCQAINNHTLASELYALSTIPYSEACRTCHGFNPRFSEIPAGMQIN